MALGPPARSPTWSRAAWCAPFRSATSSGRRNSSLSIKAASPGLYRAVRATLASGSVPDAGHSARADRVAVLGVNAAAQLGIVVIDQQPAIFIGDNPYLVLGILSGVARQPSLLDSVIIPEGTARKDWGLPGPGSVQIEAKLGAVNLIAAQGGVGAQPEDPNLVKVAAPPDPRLLKGNIKNDLNALFLLLGGVSSRRCHRHRQRHPRLGPRAGGRDRSQARTWRRASAHRSTVPDGKNGHGPGRRDPRREPRIPDRRGRGRRTVLDPRAGPLGTLERAAAGSHHRTALGNVSVASRRDPSRSTRSAQEHDHRIRPRSPRFCQRTRSIHPI